MGVSYSLDHFLERGGFPEPFLEEEALEADRWRLQYIDSLLREDVLEFDNIQNLNAIRLVFEMLRGRVGSPVSYKSIAEDVQIAPNTVKKYVQILEALYIVFRVTPFSQNIARSLIKEPKLYFFDTGFVKGDNGARFENFVGTCLLKHVYGKIDYQAKNYSLHYFQTKEKHEVDFALVCDQQVEQLIEVKNSNHSVGKGLRYFHEKYDLPACQIVKNLKRERVQDAIQVLRGDNFLQSLDF